MSFAVSYTIIGELGANTQGQRLHAGRVTLNAGPVPAGHVPRRKHRPGRIRDNPTDPQKGGGGQHPCCGDLVGVPTSEGNLPNILASRVCPMSRVRRRNSATKSCRDGTGRAPRPLPAPKGSRGDRGCPCVPVALVAFLLASLASVQPGSAFTWVADGAAVLPQQGPLFYEAAIAQLANQANLSTDPVAAAQYFLNPNQTDANGCTTIVVSIRPCPWCPRLSSSHIARRLGQHKSPCVHADCSGARVWCGCPPKAQRHFAARPKGACQPFLTLCPCGQVRHIGQACISGMQRLTHAYARLFDAVYGQYAAAAWAVFHAGVHYIARLS